MYIIGLFLTFILFPAGVCLKSECDELWSHWKEENVCIGVFDPHLTWWEARQFCQALTGDLVQIWSEDKLEFVKIVRYHRTCPQTTSTTNCADQDGDQVSHWVGAYKTSEDDGFKMINGTEMNSEVGHWENDWKLEGCLSLLQGEEGWLGSPCTERYRPICEMQLNKPDTDHDNQTKCTLEDCPCEGEDWIPLNNTRKYIKVVKVETTRSLAARLCERLGGQLLTVKDQETESFLKGMNSSSSWRPWGAFYWLGLIKDGAIWTWNGEESLKFHHYQNWYDTITPLSHKCVAVIWDYDAKWRKIDCQRKSFYICETTGTSPCRSSPVLTVGDNTKDTESLTISSSPSSSLTLTVNDDLVVECSSQGYVSHLTILSFNCMGLTPRQAVTGAVLALRYFPIGFESHNNTCSCRVIHQDGYAEEKHTTIYVQGPPEFAERSGNSLIQRVDPKKSSTVFKFKIIANPKPYVAHLKKLETGIDIADFDVRYHEMDEPIHYQALLTLPNDYVGEKNSYLLLIHNGFGIGLRVNFTLHRSNTSGTPTVRGGLHVPFGLYTVLGALALFFVVQFALLYYLWRVKSRQSERKPSHPRGRESTHHPTGTSSSKSKDSSEDAALRGLEDYTTDKTENDDKSSVTLSDASSSSLFDPLEIALFRESLHPPVNDRRNSGTSV